jgi:hypothetical protein
MQRRWLLPLFIGCYQTKSYAEENVEIGKLASDYFVDVLRRNNINALLSKDSNPVIEQQYLLVKGEITDYLLNMFLSNKK